MSGVGSPMEGNAGRMARNSSTVSFNRCRLGIGLPQIAETEIPAPGVRRHRVPCYRVLEDFRDGGKDKLGDRLGSLPYSLDERDYIGGCHVACHQTAQVRNDNVVDMVTALFDRVGGQAREFLIHVIGRQLAEALPPLVQCWLSVVAGHVRALLNLGARLGCEFAGLERA